MYTMHCHAMHRRTASPHAKNQQTNKLEVWFSEEFPTDLGIPPWELRLRLSQYLLKPDS